MYFKIKNTILFRQYHRYGYITDNSVKSKRFDLHDYPNLQEIANLFEKQFNYARLVS